MANISSLAEVDGGTIQYSQSLFCLLGPSVQKYPQNLAAIIAHQNPDHLSELVNDLGVVSKAKERASCLAWTYAELHHAALKTVIAFRQQGIPPGSTIVTLLPNGLEWSILWWAAILGKYTFSPIDVGALGAPRATELQNLLNRVKPRAIIVPGAEGAAAVDATRIVRHDNQILLISVLPEPLLNGWVSLCAIAAQPLDTDVGLTIMREAQTDDLNRVQLICFTSGTSSGRPKGCPRTVRNTMHATLAQGLGSYNDETARNLLQTATFRIIAPTIALGSWMQGACIVMPSPTFSPSHVLQAIGTHGVRMINFSPAMLHALVADPSFPRTNLQSLKTIMIGSDMITQGLYAKACQYFPECEIIPSHGMTEGGTVMSKASFTGPGLKGPQPIPFYAGISSLGKVNQGTRLRIANDQNFPVRRNEVGELHYSNGSFVTHYLDNEKPEDFYVDSEGRSWFKSGDTGIINDEGWVFILGRKKDIIKRAGLSITPGALESCIDVFLGSSSSVIGIEDAVLGQVPFAVVQRLTPPKTKADVEQHVVAMFGKEYTLGGVATLEQLGFVEWPLNATGKVMKTELKQPVMTHISKNMET